nr:PREDICTED: protein FAR1-RELATED SEQUENCE 5-like [Daucus carota subsp. sativus]
MGRNPVVIIIDQCPAMKIAVPTSFNSSNGLVSSKHRLCMWHIMEKFPDKLGNRLCKETDFMEKMKTYIWDSHLEIAEFEEGLEASAMERQRNETERLDHESDSFTSNIVSRWFIEDDAVAIFTREIFYKIQEEILAGCLDMQIKRMSEEIDGVTALEIKDVKIKDKVFKVSVSRNHAVCSCKKFVMCGIVHRHAFCGLKQIGVTKFPRSLMLNRWMKIAESGTSSAALSVSEDYLKMEEVSLKITNMWFDFRQLVNKAGVHLEKFDVVHQTVLQLTADLESSNEHADFTK